MINKFITFSIFIHLLIAVTPSQCQIDTYNGYSVRHFTDENGLPQNSINDILFDDNGFLWLASQTGLIRYNGSSFKLFYPGNKPGMESNVWNLGKGKQGNIYFQTTDGRMYCYNGRQSNILKPLLTGPASPCLLNGKGQLFDFSPFLNDQMPDCPAPRRMAIFQDLTRHRENFFPADSNACYFIFRDSLFYFSGNRLFPLAPVKNRLNQYFTLDAKCYILTADTIAAVYQHGLRLPVSGPIRGDLPHNSNAPIQLFPGDPIHFVTNNKLYSIQPARDGMLSATFLLDLGFTSHISAIAYNRDLDLLLIATGIEGFYVLHKSSFIFPHLPPEGLTQLSQYLFGPLALLNDGILTKSFKFNLQGQITFFRDTIPPRQKCLFIDDRQNVWGALYNLPKRMNTSLKTLQVYPGLKGTVVDFLQSPDKQLYCLTEQCLYQLDSDTFRLIFDNEKLHISSPNETFCFQGPGHCWIANTQGLIDFDLHQGSASLVSELNGAHVRNIHRCSDSSILLGTYGQGYYYFRHHRFYRMPLDKQKYLLTAHCFLEDHNGVIWIPSNKGLFKIPKADLDAWCEAASTPDSAGISANAITQLYYYHYGIQDGLLTNEFNGGYNAPGLITPDDHIILLSMKGLVTFQADSLRADFPRGHADISNMEIDGQFAKQGDLIELPPGYNNLLLEISCPYLGNRDNLYLEYCLQGLKDEWKEVPGDGILNLSRLGPGNYTLAVRKVNGFGRNNYQFKYWKIRVAPHFYQTSWFILFSIFTLLILLIILVQLWLKLAEKRQEVRLKAEKLKGTVETLQETVKKLQDSQKALLQTSKVREKLISLVIHDLRSPLRFLTMLATDLNDNHDQLSPAERRDRAYWIKKGTLDVYNFSEDFLLWVTSQKNNFSISRRSFPLRPLLQEIFDFFREQVQQKGNELRYETGDINIYSDPHILITVIRNLVDNANKYTEHGSILIQATENCTHTIISVKDTGRGMSPQQLEAFIQQKGMDEVRTGSQLGHKFIFDLTRRIEGTVTVESQEKIGTTVSLFFEKVSKP